MRIATNTTRDALNEALKNTTHDKFLRESGIDDDDIDRHSAAMSRVKTYAPISRQWENAIRELLGLKPYERTPVWRPSLPLEYQATYINSEGLIDQLTQLRENAPRWKATLEMIARKECTYYERTDCIQLGAGEVCPRCLARLALRL